MLDLIKIFLVFIPGFFLLRRGWGIGPVLLLVSLLLGIVYLLAPLEFLKVVLKAAFAPSTLSLVALLILIACLEQLMRFQGSISRIGKSLKRLVPSRRLSLIIMPAIWGMIPTPGGALFSAPYLVELDLENNLPPEQKTFLNYWYRHIWEYIMPIYPSVILAGFFMKIPYRELFFLQYPYTLWAVLIGFLGFRGMGKRLPPKEQGGSKTFAFLTLLKEIAPIPLILFLAVVLKLDLTLSLLIIVLGMLLYLRPDLKKLKLILKKSLTLNIITLIIGVMVFQEVLNAGGGLKGISDFLISTRLSPVFFYSGLPFLIGFLTGSQPGVVGITYPVLLSLDSGGAGLSSIPLAYVCGFCGVMLTPIHLCLSLSAEYYQANLIKVYPYLISAACLLFLFALLLYYSPIQ